VLSPLLFSTLLQALSIEFREGLQHAEDLVLMAETRSCWWRRFSNGKKFGGEGTQSKLRSDKGYETEAGVGSTENLAKWPCGVSMKGVGSNSIKCNQRSQWIHESTHGQRTLNGDVNVLRYLRAMCYF